jgi:hypothetical protein
MKRIYILTLILVYSSQSYSEESKLGYAAQGQEVTAITRAYDRASHNFITFFAFKEAFSLRFEPTSEATEQEQLAPVSFNPAKVKSGDIVFVRNPKLFFKTMHPRIKHPYILVSHGDARDKFMDEYIPFIKDKKIIAWFGIHPEGEKPHQKFFPLPLGIIWYNEHEQLYTQRAETNRLFNTLRKKVKSNLLYLNFDESAYPERTMVKKLFARKGFCFKVAGRLPFDQYIEQMASCKFTLCPRGHGLDSFRIWEALLVGSIPIVKTSQLDGLFKDLPVLIINDWQEVTQKFLNRNYKEISSRKYNREKLYVEYWLNRIFKVQKKFLKEFRR